MVHCFASLTGDRNAMHVDPEFARRFQYRQPVVHGMLPFSFIVFLEEAFPGFSLTFSTFNVRFVAPVFVGVAVRLTAEATPAESGSLAFHARWTREASDEVLIEASGSFRLRTLNGDSAGSCRNRGCLLTDELAENSYAIEDLEGKSENLRFCLDPDVWSQYQRLVFRPALGRDDYGFCPNLAASLVLSPLVGMRLPGRYATFLSFKASFDRGLSPGVPCSVSAVVEKVSRPSESIWIAAAFHDAEAPAGKAELKVMVNAPPRQMIDCSSIKERYLDIGVRGKVAVITGSSRGIGETTAKLFAMHGARTVVHYYRGEQDAAAIVEEIRAAGGTAVALGCDIREESQVSRFFAQVLEAYGRVDILVNNAVGDFRPKAFLKLRWEDYLEELEVSLKGMHNCCREAVVIFRNEGGGKIVNLSSAAVHNPVSGHSRYITSKSAVTGYTRSLAKELIEDNIQVNVVVPAMTETDLLSSIPPEYLRRMAAEREYRRHLSPIEVALSILYLSGDWSHGITGQQIVLNLGEPPFA